jgi:excisionase family DNA binding protein
MTTPEHHNTGRAEASESQLSATQNPNATPDALPRLAFTMKETATILGVSYITVHRLLKRGKLRASDAIRNKVIPRVEIERFLTESTRETSN